MLKDDSSGIRMKEFITYIIQNIVQQPDDVNVEVFEGEQTVVIEVKVHEDDAARVIGRQGNTIKALRTLAMTIAARMNKKVRLELIEEEE